MLPPTPLCRKQKRTARTEAIGSRKGQQAATRQVHDALCSSQDVSAQLSCATHSMAQPLSTMAGAPRRRHFSPHMSIKLTSTKSLNGAGTQAGSCPMVLRSANDTWSTPDRDDYHGDCTGSTFVRGDMHAFDNGEDPLASPCTLDWRCASTEWYETQANSSSHLSPPVLTRPADADSRLLSYAGSVHSVTGYSSDTFLPLPPLQSWERALSD